MTWRRRLVLAALAVPPGAVLVAWLGIFDVAASSGHWAVTEWFLHFAMRSSVRTWSLGVDPPEPLAADELGAAAGHYAAGCAVCHGAPGEPRSPAVRGMLPAPPDLVPVLGEWNDAQLFRIVKHGIRYTGMPAWPAQGRDDEVWAVVAFLRALPGLSTSDYTELVRAAPPHVLLPTACSGCHGADGRGGDPSVPILAGQSAEYLRNSLAAYASGRRASGFMELPAAGLSPNEIDELARRLAARAAWPASAAGGRVAGGRLLAQRGRPADGIPACLACHGQGRKPAFPRLDGQRPDYIEAQLRLFRSGVRGGGPYAALMHRAARRLTDADIADAAGYFASRDGTPRR